MEIPHRKSTRVALIVFGLILVGASGWAWIEQRSVGPLIVLVIGILVLWRIARVSVHIKILSDELVCFRAFSTKNVPLSELKKIVVDSSDEGTVTLYFLEAKVRLMQSRKTTRDVVAQILSRNRGVEFSDSEGWYSPASKAS